jgi:hypothetical protein
MFFREPMSGVDQSDASALLFSGRYVARCRAVEADAGSACYAGFEITHLASVGVEHGCQLGVGEDASGAQILTYP